MEESEREMVLRLQPIQVTTITVRFRDLGRAMPRIVLDEPATDEKPEVTHGA